MSKTKTLIGDRFSTVEGVRAYFVDRGWPLPVQQLDQEKFIIAQAHKWMARSKKNRNPTADIFPLPAELFELAVDSLYGPYPGTRGLRFRASRLMALQSSDALRVPLNKATGKSYSAQSAATTAYRMETGHRYKSAALAERITAGLASAYEVNPAWLWGTTDAPAASASSWRMSLHTRQQILDDYVPSWLAPWINAVEVAVSTCASMDTDLYLSDTLYGTVMLETFLRRNEESIARDLTPWSLLVYFPLAHEAMVQARNQTLGLIPDWMIPTIGLPTQAPGSAATKAQTRVITPPNREQQIPRSIIRSVRKTKLRSKPK